MSRRGRSILFSEMSPARHWEQRFNHWYDTHHVPIRLTGAPGFLAARRYRLPGEPGYLAVYELDAPTALETPAYRNIKNNPSEETRFMLENVTGFTRYVYDEIGCAAGSSGDQALEAPVLYAVFLDPPAAHEDEFDRWYAEDHVPLLMACNDWLMCRRFRAVSGSPVPARRLALHYLADRRALDSPERGRARETPWRRRLAQRDWFKPRYLVFDRLNTALAPP